MIMVITIMFILPAQTLGRDSAKNCFRPRGQFAPCKQDVAHLATPLRTPHATFCIIPCIDSTA